MGRRPSNRRPPARLLTGFLLLGLLSTVVWLPAAPGHEALLARLPDGPLRWTEQVLTYDPWPSLLLGERLLAGGDPRAALGAFGRASRRGAEDARWAAGTLDALRLEGRPDAAAGEARKMLELEPASGGLRRVLGLSLLELGDSEGGLAQLREATRLEPRRPEHWMALGDALGRLRGYTPEGTAVWEDGLRRNPGSRALRYGLADNDAGLGRYAEAEALTRELARDPVPADAGTRALYGRAWTARGTALRRAEPSPERLTEARAALERSLQLLPDFPETHYELALVLADLQQRETARQELERAIRLKPYFHPYWYQLALLDRRLGREAEAARAEARFRFLVGTVSRVRDQTQYVAAHPDDLPRRLALARLLAQREERDAARVHVEAVLRAQPGNEEARRLRARLAGPVAEGASGA